MPVKLLDCYDKNPLNPGANRSHHLSEERAPTPEFSVGGQQSQQGLQILEEANVTQDIYFYSAQTVFEHAKLKE